MVINEQEKHSVASAATLDLLGGCLCLDFANTVDGHTSDHPHEWLTNYHELVAWSEHAQVLSADEAGRLLAAAAERPAEAHAVWERAIVLREAIFRIFQSVAAEHVPTEDDLIILNAALREAMAHARLRATASGFTWDWHYDSESLDCMLWPITRSAAELLTSPELARVRSCPGTGGCGWLFLDTSKNGRRRWCSMESCGNRAKARRHYQRTRERST